LHAEREARKKAEKLELQLSNQLGEYDTADHCLNACEKHLSPTVFEIVKSHMVCKKRNPHGYRYSNGYN